MRNFARLFLILSLLAVPAVSIAQNVTSAQVDSVGHLMKVKNPRLLYQGPAPQRPSCGPIQQVVFVSQGRQYTIWETGNICQKGLRFYIRRAGSPRTGPRDSLWLMVDSHGDGVVDQGYIGGDWIDERHILSDSTKNYVREGMWDKKWENFWQQEYNAAVRASLEVLRRRR